MPPITPTCSGRIFSRSVIVQYIIFYETCHGCGRQEEGSVVRREWLSPYFVKTGHNAVLQTCLCPECAKWHPRFILKNKRIGRLASQLAYLNPGIGGCYKCGTTWDFVQGHSTAISPDSGMFPLCEGCWADLSPKDRTPYYRKLFDLWVSHGCTDVLWETIELAVLSGK